MLSKNNCVNLLKAGLLIGLSSLVLGCSPRTITVTEIREVPVDTRAEKTPPGVQEHVWEEPMVNVVDVPPGLDPEGHYYRPAHQSIVEIRQGRWNYYKKKSE